MNVVWSSDDKCLFAVASEKKDRQFQGFETGFVRRILRRAYTAP
jgi:hypothetical protein